MPQEFIFTDSEAVSWRSSTFAAGVEVKDLGEADGRAMQLVRFQPGAAFPAHKHVGAEFVYVLEGDLIQEGRRLKRGWSSIAPGGTEDAEVRSESGCVFLIIYAEATEAGSPTTAARRRHAPERGSASLSS